MEEYNIILNNKNVNYFSDIRTALFITINIIIFICFINSFGDLTQNNSLRKLAQDPRTEGVNEICMEIDGNNLYDLIDLEDKTYNLTQNIFLRFCKNINITESSCIYKEENKIIKLAGSIKGEEGNNNKIEIGNNGLVKLYLSAGEKNKNEKRYLVNIEIECDKNQSDFIANVSNFDPNNDYILNITGKSKHACVIKDKYGEDIGLVGRIIVGIILLAAGVYIGFFGYRGRKIGIFLVCISGCVVIASIILNLINETNLVVNIIVLIIFGLVGVGLSIFFCI